MTVNGLKLPDSFVTLIDRPQPLDYWVLKGDVDAYGHKFLQDLILLDSLAKIEEETIRLPISFHIADYTPEEIAEANAEDARLPGWIPFITDFSKVVYFGRTPSGEAYCFDFRDNRDEPSIIYWDDGHWVRVAPDFDTLMSLFEPL
jgi:hypothetical protein